MTDIWMKRLYKALFDFGKVKYRVVEQDVEEPIGHLHATVYDDIKSAQVKVDELVEALGDDYYNIFIVEVYDE